MRYAILCLLFLTACGQDAQIVQGPVGSAGSPGLQGPEGPTGSSGPSGSPAPEPSVSPAPAPSPNPYAVVAEIHPCNNTNPGSELLWQQANGQIVGIREKLLGAYLTVLAPGNYVTSDGNLCCYMVHSDGTVTW
jgi:hypothetical protein